MIFKNHLCFIFLSYTQILTIYFPLISQALIEYSMHIILIYSMRIVCGLDYFLCLYTFIVLLLFIWIYLQLDISIN